MEKIWFIIKEREHVGPYTQEELLEFFERGSLSETSAVWRSGLDEAIALNDILQEIMPAKNNLVIEADADTGEATFTETDFQEDVDEDEVLSLLNNQQDEPFASVDESDVDENEDDLPPPLPPVLEQNDELEFQELSVDMIKVDQPKNSHQEKLDQLEQESEQERVSELEAMIADEVEPEEYIVEGNKRVENDLADNRETEIGADNEEYEFDANDEALEESTVNLSAFALNEDDSSTPAEDLNEEISEEMSEDFSEDSAVRELSDIDDLENNEELVESDFDLNADDLAQDSLSNSKKSFKKKALLISGFIIFSMFFKLGLEIHHVYYQGFDKPSSMFSSDYKRLSKSFKNSPVEESVELAFSKDYGQIWASANFPYNARVKLVLSSIRDSILGDEDVVISSIGSLESKLISFKSYEFEKGYKVSPGLYQMKLSLIHKEYESFWLDKIVKLPKTLTIQKEVYVGHMDQVKFEKQLLEYNAKKKSQNKKFWNDLFQRYETLRAISAQIYDDFEKVLTQVKEQNFNKSLKKFERDYRNKYGQFLTSFTLESQTKYEQIQKSIVHDKRDLISRHTRLTSLAKEIGATSMDILIKLERIDIKQDIVGTDHVKSELMGKLVTIEKECNSQIQQIQEKL